MKFEHLLTGREKYVLVSLVSTCISFGRGMGTGKTARKQQYLGKMCEVVKKVDVIKYSTLNVFLYLCFSRTWFNIDMFGKGCAFSMLLVTFGNKICMNSHIHLRVCLVPFSFPDKTVWKTLNWFSSINIPAQLIILYCIFIWFCVYKTIVDYQIPRSGK